jgi:hypothetical protein
VWQRLSRDFRLWKTGKRAIAHPPRPAEQQSWAHLLDLIKACSMGTADADTTPPQAGELPKGIDAGALEAFCKQGPARMEQEGNEELFREACIALEVWAETDSPDEDRGARMQYQMRRLVTGLGNRRNEEVRTREDHVNAFLALRPPRYGLNGSAPRGENARIRSAFERVPVCRDPDSNQFYADTAGRFPVAALQVVALPDYQVLRPQLQQCCGLGLLTVALAREGINGTVSGPE